MIDPKLYHIFLTAFLYGLGGSVLVSIIWILSRQKPMARFDQALAVGFLIGASIGAFVGIFQSMLIRS